MHEKTEREHKQIFTRNLREVATQDYFAVQLLIREYYVPGFTPSEFNSVIDTVSWLKQPENLKMFEEANAKPEKIQELPPFVANSMHTINLFFEIGKEVINGNGVCDEKVAFSLGSKQLEDDLKATTIRTAEKLMHYDPRIGNGFLESKFNPEDLGRISAFYQNTQNREKAADIIGDVLFRVYWKALVESAKILHASGNHRIDN